MTTSCTIQEAITKRTKRTTLGWQYGRLRHHSLGYLSSQIFYFRQVAEGTRDREEMLLG